MKSGASARSTKTSRYESRSETFLKCQSGMPWRPLGRRPEDERGPARALALHMPALMPLFMRLNPLLFLLQSNLLPFSICQPRWRAWARERGF